MFRLLALLPLVFMLLAMQLVGQSLLQNGRIPDDLLIVLTRDGGGGSTLHTEMSIDAKGDFTFLSRGNNGLPDVRFSRLFRLAEQKERHVEYLTPKLSREKLKKLLAEFDKVEFLRFGDDFPKEDGPVTEVTHQPSESISVRANGQTKRVPYYLGTSAKRTKILRDLAEKIRGAGIWNFEGGKIPSNFRLRYQVTDGKAIDLDLTISADGDIIQTLFKFDPKIGLSRSVNRKSVGHLSRRQVNQLITSLEAATFSAFTFSELEKNDGCTASPGVIEKRTHISVRINRVEQMYASLYDSCNVLPDTRAAQFEQADLAIKKLLRKARVLR